MTQVLFMSPFSLDKRTSLICSQSILVLAVVWDTNNPAVDNASTLSVIKPHFLVNSVVITVTGYESLSNDSEPEMR